MSNIDITVPVYGNPTTQSVRDNFAVAKTEIEALQAVVATGPYLPIAGGTLTGLLTLSGPPTVALHAATKAYVDLRLPLAGGTMTGLLTLSGPPTAALHAATRAYVDTGDATAVLLVGSTMSGPLVLSGDAVLPLGAATKQQVDAVATVAGASVPLAGGTMTGLLILSGPPTDPLGAATRAYADTKLPLAGGALTGALSLAGPPSSGLHATTKSYVDSAITNAGVGVYLPIAGGTLTGPLTLAADPGSAMHAVTKQYVDTQNGLYLPLTGGTLTGGLTGTTLTLSGTFNGNAINGSAISGNSSITTGTNAAAGAFYINGPAASSRYLLWRTAGVTRWAVAPSTTAETGSNIGADLAFYRYDDAGAFLGTALSVARATGMLTVNNGLAFLNALAPTTSDLSKHIALYSTTFGLNVSAGRMNIVGSQVVFVTGVTDRLTITAAAVTATVPVWLPADPTAALQAATKQYVDSSITGVNTSLANYLPLAGGTLTGLLTLSGAPTVNLHAATKLYVDTADNLRLLLAGGVMTGLLTLSGPPTTNLHAATKAYVDTQVSGITAFLPLAGGTMTGAITLPGDPVGNLHAATKGYVDNKVPTGGPFVPINGATMTGFLTLNADPTSNLHAATKAYVDSKASTGSYLPLSGGTLTGPLTLSADPSANLQAATKQYVDNKVPPGGPFLPISGGTVTGGLTVSGNLVAATLEGQVLFVRQGGGNGLTLSVSNQATDPIQFSGSGSGGAVFNMPLRVVQDPTVAMGVATKQYVDSSFANNTQFLLLSGGTMTGPLVLAGPPTATNQAATKGYVDTFIPLAGGVMTGLLTLSDTPTADLHAATKAYVDAGISGSLTAVSGLYLPLSGGTLTGPLTGRNIHSGTDTVTGAFYINGPGSLARYMTMRTLSVARWAIGADGTAESGSDLGSNFGLFRYADTGVYLGPAIMSAARATGATQFNYSTTFLNGILVGNVYASAPNDLTKHIQIAPGYGLTATVNRLNMISASGFWFQTNAGVDAASITASGAATFNTVTAGSNTQVTASQITLNTAAGVARQIRVNTAGVLRWLFQVNTAAESGANAGSDFVFARYDDAGASLSNIFTINRATGVTTWGVGQSLASVLAPTTSDLTRHLAVFGASYGICVSAGRMNIVGAITYFVSGTTDVGVFTLTGLNAAVIGATTPAAGTFTTLIGGKDKANYITVSGAAAAAAPSVAATGSDANIDLVLTPKGSGYVRPSPVYISSGMIDGANIGAIGGAATDYTLDLDFTTGQMDPRIVVSRASVGSYFDRFGVLQSAAINQARLEYDPVTLQPRGLLVEDSRTNYLLNSAAPVTQTTASLAATNYYVLWVVGSGSATSSAGTAAGTGFGVATEGNPNVFQVTTAGTVVVTVSGTLTRFQLELGGANTYATSFISTSGAALARSPEVITMPLTGWIGPNPLVGTFMIEGLKLYGASNVGMGILTMLNSANAGDNVGFGMGSTGAITVRNACSADAGSNYVATVGASVIGAQPFRAVHSFAPGTQSGAVNGGSLYVRNSANIAGAGVDTLVLGGLVNTTVGFRLGGYIRRLRYWPRALSAAEVVAVSRPATLTNALIDQTIIGDSLPARASFSEVHVGNVYGPSWTTGMGAPSSVMPVGSLYSRTDGTGGARLYVSAGGGTWNPVAVV